MKPVINALTEVPEAFHGEYELKDGKYHLKVEGDYPPLVAANAKIVEFRDTNINLMKELGELRPLKDLKQKFDGLDPEEARKAIDKVKKLGDKGIKDTEDVDARIRAQVDEIVKPLRDKIAESEAATRAERERANEFLLRTTIGDEFIKAGGKPNALDFVVNLAKDNFEINESKVVPKTGKFSQEKPGEPLSVTEWLSGAVAKDHDYVFKPSGGGDTAPRIPGGPIDASKLKPGQTLLKNPTPQDLGHYAKDIAEGKVKVQYDEVAQ
jgi:hypothetical protein